MKNIKQHLLQLLIVGFGLFAYSTLADAQISFGGKPLSFTQALSVRDASKAGEVRLSPDFNPDDLIAQNNWQHQRQAVPLLVGKVMDLSLDFASSAKQYSLANGSTVYRLTIAAEDAKGISLYYDKFAIPAGGRLFIYSPDKQQVLGAYTHETNPRSGLFATEPLAGNEVVLEYEAPRGVAAPQILINGVNYIFNHMRPIIDNHYETGEDASDPKCQVNVNCPDGSDWQTQKNGVVQMLMRSAGYVSLCSGDLMNNTNEDFTPLILSAGHCASIDNVNFSPTNADLQQWVFTFHYEKIGCSNGSLAVLRGNSIVGCTKKAFLPIKGQSDGLLLQLTDMVPLRYRVYYNGWDRTGAIPPAPMAGMHHPSGDAMKISIATASPVVGNWNGGGAAGGPQDHWKFNFTTGDTEGGSSGSSLFDANKRVVGTLTGGQDLCGGVNFYGRLSSHWDKYASGGNGSRMDIYLDPKTNGAAERLDGTYRQGYAPLRSVSGISNMYNEDGRVYLHWNAIDPSTYPNNYQVEYVIYRDAKEIGKTSETSFSEAIDADIIGAGLIRYYVMARYHYPEILEGVEAYKDTDRVESAIAIAPLSRKVKPSVSPADGGGVTLTWKKPMLSQLVSRFGERPDQTFKRFGVAQITPGMSNTSYTISSFIIADKVLVQDFPAKSSIAKVMVMPYAADTTFHIFLQSKGRKFTQKVTVPSDWQDGTWLTVPLSKPYVIDNQELLMAGVQVSNLQKINRSIQFAQDPDDIYQYTGGKVSYNGGKNFEGRKITALKGYLGLKYVVVPSDAATLDMSIVDEPYAKGTNVGAFPDAVQVKVYKNGQQIHVQDASAPDSFVDPNGSEGEDYEIEIIYKGGGVMGVDEPSVEYGVLAYPSVVTDQFNLRNAEYVQSMSLVSLDGKRVRSWSKVQPSVSYSVEGLAAGTYILIFNTVNGNYSQKIVKR